MHRIRALIVDDEPLARQRIRELLLADGGVDIAGECADGIDAIAAIKSRRPDLVFLDIQVPGADGFAILEALEGDEVPLVVFVTAFPEFAAKAFDVHALDYLLKPFGDERFQDALRLARFRLDREGEQEETFRRVLHTLHGAGEENGGIRRIMVKSGGHITFLRPADVEWVEAQGDYVLFHTQGKRHLVRENIGDIERRCLPATFIRIHRSTIVNIERIKELQPLLHGDYAVVLLDGTRLTMSRSFRERFFQRVPSIS